MKKRELACLDVVETSRVIDRMCCMHRDELYRPEDVQLVHVHRPNAALSSQVIREK